MGVSGGKTWLLAIIHGLALSGRISPGTTPPVLNGAQLLP